MADLGTDKCLKLELSGCKVTYYTWHLSSGPALHSTEWVLNDSLSELENLVQHEVAPIPPANWATFANFLLSEWGKHWGLLYNKYLFDVIQASQTPAQMCPSHSHSIKLTSYTVSTFMITVFDVQLHNDNSSYPGLFWTKFAYCIFVYCE
jgi:hypothetical protein